MDAGGLRLNIATANENVHTHTRGKFYHYVSAVHSTKLMISNLNDDLRFVSVIISNSLFTIFPFFDGSYVNTCISKNDEKIDR